MQTTYENTTVGFDLVKNVFYCTEMNQYMRVLRQIKLKRSQVLKNFFQAGSLGRARSGTTRSVRTCRSGAW